MARAAQPVPVTFEPGFTQHPKLRTAGPLAAWLWVCAIDHSAQALTDGHVPSAQLAELATFAGIYRDAGNGDQPILVPDTAGAYVPVTAGVLERELVWHGLFHDTDSGVVVHDFAEHQLTREQILQLAGQAQSRRVRDRFDARIRRTTKKNTSDDAVVNSSSSAVHSANYPSTTATEQSAAALSLPGETIEENVKAAHADPISYVVANLADAQGSRTFSAIRSVLANWSLPESAVLEAFLSVQKVKARGGVFHKGESAYLVGALNRIGQKGAA